MSTASADREHKNATDENPNGESTVDIPTVLPLEAIDRAIGSNIKILLTNDKEFCGKLVGFDDFVNVVLEDVVELDSEGNEGKPIKKMLLNGAQIAMLCTSS